MSDVTSGRCVSCGRLAAGCACPPTRLHATADGKPRCPRCGSASFARLKVIAGFWCAACGQEWSAVVASEPSEPPASCP